MLFFRVTIFVILFLVTSFNNVIRAQAKINVPLIECLGNLTSYSYTPPSGLTLSAATWDFGDGNGSSNLSPVHTYAAKGFYTVKINATFTNSTTRTDSVKIEVVGLPKPYFYLLPKSDSCLSNNIIRYRDTSRPAIVGQDIKSRIMVWGDGNFTSSNTPQYGDTLKHVYAVTLAYSVKLEVTDKHGCKNSMTQIIQIVDDIDAGVVIDTSWADCRTAKICFRNNSKGNNVKAGAFKWFIDTLAVDTNGYFGLTGKRCVTYKKSKTIKVMLVVLAKNGCRDTFRGQRDIVADTIPDEMEFEDTVVCVSSENLISARVNRWVWDTLYWQMNGVTNQYVKGPFFSFLPKSNFSPGIHTITAQIVRGNCSDFISRKLVVNGPIADFNIYDNNQCYSDRQIFFTDRSGYIKKQDAIYRWRIEDPFGDPCTSFRAKNINKYMNCNGSLDWYHKHKFKADTNYKVVLWVKDTVSGCTDSMEHTVYFKVCPPILGYDTVILCQGDLFMQVSPLFPEFVTMDTGKTWVNFPITLDSTHKGWYDMGFAFKTLRTPWAENFGADSLKVHSDTITYYDTAYKKRFLKVNPLKRDEFTMKIYGNCKPYRVSLYFKDGHFLKGESLKTAIGAGIPLGPVFLNDTIIDSISYVFNGAIQSFIRVKIINKEGCEWTTNFNVALGKTISLFIGRGVGDDRKICRNSTVCFSAMIYEYQTKYYWTNGTLQTRKLSWQFEDTSITDVFRPCHKFVKGGPQGFKMIMEDSFGCRDTVKVALVVQDLRANMRYLSKIVYCSELKQFFDSSTFYKPPPYTNDSITRYAWDFGKGVFSSLVKNPLQAINTSLDSIQVRHTVELLSGCKDTITFNVKVIGPKPYFNIRDTIGCGSLKATFINTSRNCKSYLWEFGDSLTSTLQTNSKKDTNFNYTKPGRYYIYLTGYDTVFNPLSGKTFYCKNTFPDKLFQKDTTRSVLVLPFRTTGIQSRDTVCLGSPFTLKSLSDTAYNHDFWQMGDNTSYDTADGSSINHVYQKVGSYTVKLNPRYNNGLQNKYCLDSAQKNILVVGVKADFDIDPLPIPPLFKFYNKSTPVSALLKWDFGHPSSGSNNNSTGQNTSHDYGNDTGRYNVCLIASIPEGCSDTICKTVYNDHLTEFQIFNVFTPGNADNKNDQYDILIEGESLYDLEIYNRWGVLVFKGDKDGDKTNDINWNGKVNNKGEECSSGTYYFIFKYSLRTEPENIKTLTGVVTLIR